MYKNEMELIEILDNLIKHSETEIVEFKEAKNSFTLKEMGKYFSAISNESNLKNKQYGWIVFGINDKTHEYVGTNFCNSEQSLNNLKKDIYESTNDMNFIEIYSLTIINKRILMFQIPAASTIPTIWKKIAYGRSGESLIVLDNNKIQQIYFNSSNDWSRQIIEKATIEDLDSEAIKKAKEQFLVKHANKGYLSSEIMEMNNIEFLNKAKLTINDKITNTALLLLGKNESDHLFNDKKPQITWILENEKAERIDYEHFEIPLILKVGLIFSKIRNIKYRYIVDGTGLFPEEIDKYDPYSIRELLNNCIVHQDYRFSRRVNIIESPDMLIFINDGNFIPNQIENILDRTYVPPFYRNQFLATAMVNLNMIDTMGSGIRRVFNNQVKRYLPLPDYELSDKNRVKVKLYGKVLDQKYTELLYNDRNLKLEHIFLLDKVQKEYPVSKGQYSELLSKDLVEGKYPNIYISSKVASITQSATKYLQKRGLNDSFYKKLIIELIKMNNHASRDEINELLFSKLPSYLNNEEKWKKITNLIEGLKRNKIIKNIGVRRYPIWTLNHSSQIEKLKETERN